MPKKGKIDTTVVIEELDLTENEKLFGFLGYFLGWIGTLIIILTKKHEESEFLAFVAYQSLLISIITMIGSFTCVIAVIGVLSLLYLSIMAYTGKKVSFPIVGPMAEDMAKKR